MNSSTSSPCHRSRIAEAEATSPMVSPTKIGRRCFLFATAGFSLALPQVGFAVDAAKSPNRAPVVDNHVHCFAGKDDARFPYHRRAPYRPDAPATPQHLLRCMDEAGVDFVIIVHPEPYQDDHRYLEYCFEIGKSRFKGTCLFFADQPESLAKMPDLVVIDHLGRPFQGTPDEHEVVIRWSRFKNTVMKLSAIPSPNTYPHRNIGPIIKRLAQEFGPDRMIYGGGFSSEATGTTYRAAREQARSEVSFLSAADQAKVFGENAARLFGFKRS